MWKHLLTHGDSHASSQQSLDGSAPRGHLPLLKPPQPQGTEDVKSSASYVPWAFLGLSQYRRPGNGSPAAPRIGESVSLECLKVPQINTLVVGSPEI